MKFDFKDKKVLITGGSRGIGAETAYEFALNGAAVTITGTSSDSQEVFRKKYPDCKVDFLSVDFLNLESIKNFIKEIEGQGFDILINNAGINKINHISDIRYEEWQEIQDVNVRAPFLISQALIPSMRKKKWGRIINISSIYGVVTREQRLSYTTSKYGIIGLSKTLALELAPDNILVNVISPGFVDTDLTRQVLGEKGIEEVVQKVPLKRLASVQDISGAILFLSSERNGFITGQNLVIDGGFTCA